MVKWFAANNGSLACEECASPRTTTSSGATACDSCDNNFYLSSSKLRDDVSDNDERFVGRYSICYIFKFTEITFCFVNASTKML